MNKLEWKKIGLGTIIAILLILVLLSVVNFVKKSEDITIDTPNPNQGEEFVFRNLSDMKEPEIRELVEEKRIMLKTLFQDAKYYTISEVSKEHTKEDDEIYIAIGESFLKDFQNLVTDKLYTEYWEELVEVTPKENILLNERIYLSKKDLFDNIYFYSAISMQNVTEEHLILKSATNEKIEAIENIKFCEENDLGVCKRDDYYSLTLEKENDEWKINEFRKKIDK